MVFRSSSVCCCASAVSVPVVVVVEVEVIVGVVSVWRKCLSATLYHARAEGSVASAQ